MFVAVGVAVKLYARHVLRTACAVARVSGVITPPAPAGHAGGAELVLAAMNFLDTRYRLGGNSAADGFDCSGFTRHVYATALGVALPRRSVEQARQPGWHEVAPHQLQPGDLVFFHTLGSSYSHVGIYVGNGKMVAANNGGVEVVDIFGPYWGDHFTGYGRM